MAFSPKYTVTAQMLANLAKIEVIKQQFENQPISPQLLLSLRESAKVATIHYSTQIEGNRLTGKEVAEALKGRKLPQREKDEQEVKAYYKAWNAMEEAVVANRSFDEKLIANIHSLVEASKSIIPYRDNQNAIYDSETGAKIYLPPEAKDVPEMMQDFCQWVQNAGNLPVPLVAGIVHYQFVTIHPYYDGNGRTARLLTSFIMRKGGYGLKGIYSLEEYYAKDLIRYYDALQTHPHHNYYYGRHEADITSWLEYFIAGVADAFAKVNEHAKDEKTKGFTADKSPLLRELDIKQRKVLELFAEFKEVNSLQISEILGVSAQSARALLRQWIAEGFLKYANESKKARTYRLAERFEKLV
ncbi:MAG: Fic family protein [Alphaproteobacteria bacterium]